MTRDTAFGRVLDALARLMGLRSPIRPRRRVRLNAWLGQCPPGTYIDLPGDQGDPVDPKDGPMV